MSGTINSDNNPETEYQAAVLEFKRSQKGQVLKFWSFIFLVGIGAFFVLYVALSMGDAVKAIVGVH